MSWGETLDQQKSALRWDIKRSLNNLCRKLADIGEECFVVTVNISNGWVGHMGSVRGNEYINQKSFIPYDFLDYCRELDESRLNFTDQANDEGDDKEKEEEDDTGEDDGGGGGGDDNVRVAISRYQSDSSMDDENKSPILAVISQDAPHTDGNKLRKIKSKKIIKHARQHLIRTLSKNQRRQSEPDSTKGNPSPGTRIRANSSTVGNSSLGDRIRTLDGNFGLYCTPCEVSFPNRSSFMAHIKCRPHLLKSKRLLQCFKCFQAFDSSKDMYTHMRSCDMLASLLHLVKPDHVSDMTASKVSQDDVTEKQSTDT